MYWDQGRPVRAQERESKKCKFCGYRGICLNLAELEGNL